MTHCAPSWSPRRRALALCAHLGVAALIGCGGATAADASLADASSDVAPADDASSHDGGLDAASDGSSADAALPITGRACVDESDCGEGYSCMRDAPGGYCVTGRPGGPLACREPEAPCPSGTICSPLPMHQISGVCLAPCTTAGDCRPGLVCTTVALFPGDPGSPTSPSPACWYACVPGADPSCNDDPRISSIHGSCGADGTCTCSPGFAKNPATGRCL